MRKYTVARSFLMIASVLASSPFHIVRRQGITLEPATTTAQASTAQSPSGAASASTAVTSRPVSSSSLLSSSPLASPATSASTSVASSAAPSSTATPTSSAVGSTSPPSSTPSSVVPVTTSETTSLDAQGSPVTTVVVISSTPTTSSASSSATAAPQDNSIHSGTIIGLSVAGGVAALALVAFIIWKLTRKRFSDLDDAGEAIKWPELHREGHTDGGSGGGLSPQVSNTYPASALSRNPSTFDQGEQLDPYAVPPLPQFNPNQPYRDDPYASSNAYYDPYRGPVPQTFHDGSMDGHENIPMSTYPPGSRSRSPGPGMAYDMGGRGSPAPGRASPALGQDYDVGARGSPVPGRTISPGPAAALGLDRRPTPGIQGGLSGPPEMAIRNRSPGPNVLA